MRHIYIIAIAFLLSACSGSIPSVKPYKLEIQQGNVVTSKMLLQLRPGMTRSQVRYIMGTPLIKDSFHSDRWDYFYQMRQRGRVVEQRRVILSFNKDLLAKVSGDVVAKEGDVNAGEGKDKGIRVLNPNPVVEKGGFFERLKFWKKEDEAAMEAANKAAEETEVLESVPVEAIAAPIKIEPIEMPQDALELPEEKEEKSWLDVFDKLQFWDDEVEPKK